MGILPIVGLVLFVLLGAWESVEATRSFKAKDAENEMRWRVRALHSMLIAILFALAIR